eukprot:271715-Chlamydomonas_euryale.AAC.4
MPPGDHVASSALRLSLPPQVLAARWSLVLKGPHSLCRQSAGAGGGPEPHGVGHPLHGLTGRGGAAPRYKVRDARELAGAESLAWQHTAAHGVAPADTASPPSVHSVPACPHTLHTSPHHPARRSSPSLPCSHLLFPTLPRRLLEAAWPILSGVAQSGACHADASVVEALCEVYQRSLLAARRAAALLLPTLIASVMAIFRVRQGGKVLYKWREKSVCVCVCVCVCACVVGTRVYRQGGGAANVLECVAHSIEQT